MRSAGSVYREHPYTQLVLFICRFHVCKFACLITYLYPPKSAGTVLLQSFVAMCRAVKNLSLSLAQVEKGDFLFQFSHCKEVDLVLRIFFCCIFCFLLVTLLFKMAPKHSAKGLVSVPNYKKAIMYLMEKIHVLLKLPSGMSYNAFDCEFNDTK